MENKEFDMLLSAAEKNLDDLQKIIKDTVKKEELIIQNVLDSQMDSKQPNQLLIRKL